jgi:hypothetical protein
MIAIPNYKARRSSFGMGCVHFGDSQAGVGTWFFSSFLLQRFRWTMDIHVTIPCTIENAQAHISNMLRYVHVPKPYSAQLS